MTNHTVLPGRGQGRTAVRSRPLLAGVLAAALLLPALLLPSLAGAQSGTYTWHDGKREYTITLDPGLVVEYGGAPEADASTLQRSAPAAERVSRQGQVTLWRVPAGSSSALSQARSLDSAAAVSPVFRDGSTGNGPLRALTGRIVVRFAEDLSQADAAAWGAEQGLQLVRSLPLKQTHYLFAGSLGLATLEKANTLRTLPEVAAAFPDWWQPRTTR